MAHEMRKSKPPRDASGPAHGRMAARRRHRDIRRSDRTSGCRGAAAGRARDSLPLGSESDIVFVNKRHTRVKLLCFDGTGLWLATKRLERGTFSWPEPSETGQRKITLQPEALRLLLDGVYMRGAKFRPWYERP